MGYQKGGTVNISDAFESYGIFLEHQSFYLIICQVHMPWAKSMTRRDLMLFDMLALVLAPAEECIRMFLLVSKSKSYRDSANTMSSALEVLGMVWFCCPACADKA